MVDAYVQTGEPLKNQPVLHCNSCLPFLKFKVIEHFAEEVCPILYGLVPVAYATIYQLRYRSHFCIEGALVEKGNGYS